MMRTRIKFCGMTRPEDAAEAARLGVDAVGMVFHRESGRFVGEPVAREIMAAVGAFVTPVGLFVDSPVEEVRELSASLGLRHIQLHGHESPAYVSQLGNLKVLKAVRVEKGQLWEALSIWKTAKRDLDLKNLAGILLETAVANVPGGSGQENDWTTIYHAKENDAFAGLPPIIVAGGLRAENVGAVIRQIGPWAVDVSSGIEHSRGKKSAQKMAAFVEAVKLADVGIEGRVP